MGEHVFFHKIAPEEEGWNKTCSSQQKDHRVVAHYIVQSHLIPGK